MEVETGNEPQTTQPQTDPKEKKARKNRKDNLTGGLVLIAIGLIFLLEKYIPTIRFGDLWPIILIVIGFGLLLNAFRNKPEN